MCDVNEEVYFSQKNRYKSAKHEFAKTCFNIKNSPKAHRLYGREKVPGATLSKEYH